VKTILLKALSVLAFEYQVGRICSAVCVWSQSDRWGCKTDHDLCAFARTYNRVKLPEDPLNGLPLAEGDTTFDISNEPGREARRHNGRRIDLWAEAELGQSNANMLHEVRLLM
jgi:hypothetical protein